jgi:hypothetical protein
MLCGTQRNFGSIKEFVGKRTMILLANAVGRCFEYDAFKKASQAIDRCGRRLGVTFAWTATPAHRPMSLIGLSLGSLLASSRPPWGNA